MNITKYSCSFFHDLVITNTNLPITTNEPFAQEQRFLLSTLKFTGKLFSAVATVGKKTTCLDLELDQNSATRLCYVEQSNVIYSLAVTTTEASTKDSLLSREHKLCGKLSKDRENKAKKQA